MLAASTLTSHMEVIGKFTNDQPAERSLPRKHFGGFFGNAPMPNSKPAKWTTQKFKRGQLIAAPATNWHTTERSRKKAGNLVSVPVLRQRHQVKRNYPR
jgi:hypothetical protein